MKANQYILLFFSIAIGVTIKSHAQTQKDRNYLSNAEIRELGIGNKVPPLIWKKIPTTKNTELVILDFWASTCEPCIKAFSKMEHLQAEFGEKLQIVLINSDENGLQVKERFKRINKNRDKNKLITIPNLPSITGDTVFKKLFPFATIPHHVWIDGEGKVLYITQGYNATTEHVRKVLDKENVSMELKRDLREEGYVAYRDGLIRPAMPEFNFVFSSCFMKYNPGLNGSYSFFVDSVATTIRIIHTNSSIVNLYKSAFQCQRKDLGLILKVKNKKDFDRPKNDNLIGDWNERNLFSYELRVPTIDKEKSYQFFQEDLNRFFTNLYGIVGKIEKLKIPCFLLVKVKDGMLKSTGNSSFFKVTEDSVIIKNVEFSFLTIRLLKKQLEDMDRPIAFVDATGIDSNTKIDLQLTGDLKDVKNLRRQLQQYGLDLIEDEKELEVLVITDYQ